MGGALSGWWSLLRPCRSEGAGILWQRDLNVGTLVGRPASTLQAGLTKLSVHFSQQDRTSLKKHLEVLASCPIHPDRLRKSSRRLSIGLVRADFRSLFKQVLTRWMTSQAEADLHARAATVRFCTVEKKLLFSDKNSRILFWNVPGKRMDRSCDASSGRSSATPLSV